MFDRDVYLSVTENVDRYNTTTIHEHRAPTDKSVELLNEMTNKAHNNLIKQFSTSNNTLQMTCAVWENYAHQEKEFWCKYVLNGKENIIKIAIPEWKYPNHMAMIEALYLEVCNRLAQDFMQPLLSEMKVRNGL